MMGEPEMVKLQLTSNRSDTASLELSLVPTSMTSPFPGGQAMLVSCDLSHLQNLEDSGRLPLSLKTASRLGGCGM